jgi:hypothetical protein
MHILYQRAKLWVNNHENHIPKIIPELVHHIVLPENLDTFSHWYLNTQYKEINIYLVVLNRTIYNFVLMNSCNNISNTFKLWVDCFVGQFELKREGPNRFHTVRSFDRTVRGVKSLWRGHGSSILLLLNKPRVSDVYTREESLPCVSCT